eukprot:TRINITY_DN14227_c0_g1_i1.p1 TRINITY_DN14227_c0_g1~~TRINITY_DN14227_c0_g1_i1.p1  ORF type:complete len:426 (+),score=123.11 TRINITY_DN14227_c0_g1_i1:88-1278(+)
MVKSVLPALCLLLVRGAEAQCDTSNLGYSCQSTVDSSLGLIVHWTYSSSSGTADMALEISGTGGWHALGFPSSANTMAGTTAYIYTQSTTTTGFYRISARSLSGLTKIVAGDSGYITNTGASTETAGSRRILRVNGIALSSLPGAGRRAATLSPSINLVWSMHPSDSGTFPNTRHQSRGGVSLDLGTGSVAVQTLPIEDDVHTHAVMLIMAWCYFAPLTIIFKRHADRLGLKRKHCGKTGGFWMHMLFSTTVFALTIAGVTIGLRDLDADRTRWAHRNIGITVLALVCLQLILGVVATAVAHSTRIAYFVHAVIGSTALALGFVNCMTGSQNYRLLYTSETDSQNRRHKYAIAAAVGFGFFFLLANALEIARCACPVKPDDEDKEAEPYGEEQPKD